MADSDFLLGEYTTISKIWLNLQVSKLMRSSISYTVHHFVTADDGIIAADTAFNLPADLLFLEITCTYNSSLIKKMLIVDIHGFTFSLMRFSLSLTSTSNREL